ncbi:hypothetical protein [Blastopirellula marina]|uniref:Leucine-rich repeat domain-containing protein n=1 Tax=Blastopirellula marina TaxID=124 RepID=A0A2S8GN95_9BACT|nr:hypothetical protein [Blastopirellula marina]PQO45897.1 hypothetical protein C5Y93_11625 [Blastopirellula marina]
MMIPSACVRLTACVILLCNLLIAGCSDGLSEYQRDQLKMQAGQDSLAAIGAKVEMKRFPQGDAWAVDLSGKTISSETFADLATLRRVVELDLSGTNFNDDFVPLINDTMVRDFLLKLNLSDTAVTDRGLEGLTETYLLNNLNVSNTQVTKNGVTSLKGRWPTMKIVND